MLMTEKDAVKCLPLITSRHWCLKVQAELPQDFYETLTARLVAVKRELAAFELRPVPGVFREPYGDK